MKGSLSQAPRDPTNLVNLSHLSIDHLISVSACKHPGKRILSQIFAGSGWGVVFTEYLPRVGTAWALHMSSYLIFTTTLLERQCYFFYTGGNWGSERSSSTACIYIITNTGSGIWVQISLLNRESWVSLGCVGQETKQRGARGAERE